MSFSEADVQGALKNLIDPNTKKDFASGKSLKNIKISGNDISLDILLGYPAQSVLGEIRATIEAHLTKALPGSGKISVNVTSKVVPHTVQQGVKLVSGVKNIIAVASGKGGVGKSTTAVNIALALAAEGARVGVLDADIYGPSQPTMLGISGHPETSGTNLMEPMTNHGLQAMSIGFLVGNDDTPMIWRGPMAIQALNQLLRQTHWDDLDYLIVDLPPGTGDIQLSLAQQMPITGAIIVTTPQDIALMDARKGLKMFEKVGVRIIGLVENMSTHICSKCGHEEHIFGSGGGEKMCADYNTELLGSLPLDIRIREQTDAGKPTVVADPDGNIAKSYKQIARRVAVKVAEMAQNHSTVFPKVVMLNT